MSGVLAINQYILDLLYEESTCKMLLGGIVCVDLAIEEKIEKEMGDEIDEIDKRGVQCKYSGGPGGLCRVP